MRESTKFDSAHKQFATDGSSLVNDSLLGLVAANPQLVCLPNQIVARAESLKPHGKVAIVSGGGAGHDPTHAGFVGDGLLDAVAVGQIFASPSAKQISQAIAAVSFERGSLLVVKNYTGDVLHFGLAAERARAAGKDVRVLVVGDDVAVGRKQGNLVGRRGLAGVVLVHKVTGAAAAEQRSLDEVYSAGEAVVNNLATIAASLDHCTVPGRSFTSELARDEYELGLGIHNEAGVERRSPIPSLKDLITCELVPMLFSEDPDRSFVKFNEKDEVLLLINNLGGLSPFEITYAVKVAKDAVTQQGAVSVVRVLVGTFTTAFDGPGLSVSLLNVTSARKQESSVLELLDAPARAQGWNLVTRPNEWTSNSHVGSASEIHAVLEDEMTPSDSVTLPETFSARLTAAARRVVKAEPDITRYDQIAGDGDAGETLKAGAEAILKAIEQGGQLHKATDANRALATISELVDEAMGGTSGGLYSIYLTAFGGAIASSSHKELTSKAVRDAAAAALTTLKKYTKARLGDRTLMDALEPFVEALQKGLKPEEAVLIAETEMQKTAQMTAKAGRAAYVQQSDLASEDVPDPGAYGLIELLKGLVLQ